MCLGVSFVLSENSTDFFLLLLSDVYFGSLVCDLSFVLISARLPVLDFPFNSTTSTLWIPSLSVSHILLQTHTHTHTLCCGCCSSAYFIFLFFWNTENKYKLAGIWRRRLNQLVEIFIFRWLFFLLWLSPPLTTNTISHSFPPLPSAVCVDFTRLNYG